MIISFANRDIELTPEGAVWIPDLQLVCIADMHFEKGSFFSRTSTFLPPYDTQETIKKLAKVLALYRPRIFIAVGDSFHDKNAALRMRPEWTDELNQLVDSVDKFYWLAGNHDAAHPGQIKGNAAEQIVFGNIIFRHQSLNKDEIEISGHYHPKARFYIHGHYISAPCFARYQERIILPSFGHYTGGLDINSADFQKVMPKKSREIFLLHQQQIVPFSFSD